jgi:hypothetical protein
MIDTQNSAHVFIMALTAAVLFFGGIHLGSTLENSKEDWPFAVIVPLGFVLGMITVVSLAITIAKSL